MAGMMQHPKIVRWLLRLWPFRRRKLARPFAPLIDPMKAKDRELYDAIKHLPAKQGIAIWRERYPEDFQK